jgi:hypothetical protein
MEAVGFHEWVDLLRLLEIRLEAQAKAEELALVERKKTLELLKSFRKGE